jgi:hypothetical protein
MASLSGDRTQPSLALIDEPDDSWISQGFWTDALAGEAEVVDPEEKEEPEEPDEPGEGEGRAAAPAPRRRRVAPQEPPSA